MASSSSTATSGVPGCTVGQPCDDGNACTEDDTCTNGLCAGTPLDCNDHNECTTDACEMGRCVNAPDNDGVECDDSDACTVGELCFDGTCGYGEARSCNDGDACTADSCDPALGCRSTVLAGMAGYKSCNGQCVPLGNTADGCGRYTCTPCIAPRLYGRTNVFGTTSCLALEDENGEYSDFTCVQACPVLQGEPPAKLVDNLCYSVMDGQTGCGNPGTAACPPSDIEGPVLAECSLGSRPDGTVVSTCSYSCDFGSIPQQYIVDCPGGCCTCFPDGFCNPGEGENPVSCPNDCPLSALCGNGFCDAAMGENHAACASDCLCGDGSCAGPETPSECPSDCDLIPPTVTITSPEANATISGRLVIRGMVTDNVGVASVTYALSGGTGQVPVPGQQGTGPFEFELSVAQGTRTLTVTVTDLAGQSAQASVTFTSNACPAMPSSDICLGVDWVGTPCKTVTHRDACIEMARAISMPSAMALTETAPSHDFTVDAQGNATFRYDAQGNPIYVDTKVVPYDVDRRMHYANPGSALFSGSSLSSQGLPRLPAGADPAMFRVVNAPDGSPQRMAWANTRREPLPQRSFRFGFNGNNVRSCEEYVAEKYFGWTLYEERIKPFRDDPHRQLTELAAAVSSPNGFLTYWLIRSRHDAATPVRDPLDLFGNRYDPRSGVQQGTTVNVNTLEGPMMSEYAEFRPITLDTVPLSLCRGLCPTFRYNQDLLYDIGQAYTHAITVNYTQALAYSVQQRADPARGRAEWERMKNFRDLVARRAASAEAFTRALATWRETGDDAAGDRVVEEHGEGYALDTAIQNELFAARARGCLNGTNPWCIFTVERWLEALRFKVQKRLESDMQHCVEVTRNEFACQDAQNPGLPANNSPEAAYLCRLQHPGALASYVYTPGDYRTSSAGIDQAMFHADEHIRAILATLEEGLEINPQSGRIERIGQEISDEWSTGADIFGVYASYNMGWELMNVKPNPNNTEARVGAEAEGGVRVFGTELEIINAGASAETDSETGDDKVVVDIHLRLFGINVWGSAGNFTGSWSKMEEEKQEIDVEPARAVIMIFFIPLTIKGGISAEMGFEMGVRAGINHNTQGALTTEIKGVMRPYFEAKGTLTVSVDLLIAEIGLQGQITLLETALPLEAGVELFPEMNDIKMQLGMELKLENSTLNGKIIAFQRFLWWQAEQKLIAWDGFSDTQVLWEMKTDPVGLNVLLPYID